MANSLTSAQSNKEMPTTLNELPMSQPSTNKRLSEVFSTEQQDYTPPALLGKYKTESPKD